MKIKGDLVKQDRMDTLGKEKIARLEAQIGALQAQISDCRAKTEETFVLVKGHLQRILDTQAQNLMDLAETRKETEMAMAFPG